jgi:hypothetical protein
MLRPAVLLFVLLILSLLLFGQADDSASHGMSTTERFKQAKGWWPRKDTTAREDYAGPAACAKCHSSISGTQKDSAMARTSSLATGSNNLRSVANRFTVGNFSYEIHQSPNEASYTVRTGADSLTEPLGWVFGSEKVGQTYVYEKDGQMYESAFSYFSGIHGFGQTPGLDLVPLPDSVPQRLRKGAARPLEKATAEGCFTCHNTAAKTSGKLDPAQLIPNVTCEACHGPASAHVAAEKAGMENADALVFNPKFLDSVASVDFCGSCHRTWWDVMLTEEVGVSTILAVPYRLEKSRCWSKGDARLTCVACHDPHGPLEQNAAAYDQHCLSCHVTKDNKTAIADHPGAACPVSTSQCVTCHMAKYEVPDMHARFTDHMIRVVKPGAPFAD